MENTLIQDQLSDMIFVQDLIESNKEVVKRDVVSMYKSKKLTKEEFDIFMLKHGMANDGKQHTFSEIAQKFDYTLEDTLKNYNNALKIVSKYVVDWTFGRNSSM